MAGQWTVGSIAFVCAAILFASGCDKLQGGAAAEVEPSRLFETCARSADCAKPLRCIEHRCDSPTAVPLGDYYWAEGNRHKMAGKPTDAQKAYQKAVLAYEEKQAVVPPELLCSYGSALRGDASDPKNPERAARLLHRCSLASAPGSSSRRFAFAELAELSDRGLDVALLGQDSIKDAYLTKAPEAPPVDNIKVAVAAKDEGRGRGYRQLVEEMGQEDVRRKMAPCMIPHATKTQASEATAVVKVDFKARWDDFDEIYLGGELQLQGEGEMGKCAAEALQDFAAEFGKKSRGGSFDGSVAVTFTVAGG